MKEVYAKTKNKIQTLWTAIAELNGNLEIINEQILSLQKSIDAAWKELNKPNTVYKKGYDIDIKECYLIERDKDGNVVLDENGNEKTSPLYNTNNNRTQVIWDKDQIVWKIGVRKVVGTWTVEDLINDGGTYYIPIEHNLDTYDIVWKSYIDVGGGTYIESGAFPIFVQNQTSNYIEINIGSDLRTGRYVIIG